jgi:hypothetical protein
MSPVDWECDMNSKRTLVLTGNLGITTEKDDIDYFHQRCFV